MRFVHVNAGLFGVSDIAQTLSVSAEDDLAILALSAIKVPSQPLGIFVCEVRRVRSVCPVVFAPDETGFRRADGAEHPECGYVVTL